MFINQFNQAKEHVSNQHLSITDFKFHCIAVFTLYLELLNGSTFSSWIDSKDSKLRQGLILWPKLAASSNTVSEKWRQQRFNSTFALHLKADSHHNSSYREKIKSKLFSTCFSFHHDAQQVAKLMFFVMACISIHLSQNVFFVPKAKMYSR